ncbi:hypothetical protein O1611_g2188 [Lasiodiplodia mahajangana]|uniref:Uncharacterized protein n=1 Tax=Lasiodiplodia mahajangana TaxID=1108764 RepID=A0ACC2JVT3_9PEZI|nr:hypothetical protein O1611_g2188 [Lasiodiplodia mahajangana]
MLVTLATINMLLSALLLAAIAVMGVKVILFIFKRQPGPLPPGPKGLPFIGDIAGLPLDGEREWEHWLKHKDTYGPISSLRALGTTFVILHSPELTLELLEKRSLKYSYRPRFEFAEINGYTNILGMSMASAVILKLLYGYTVEPHKPDPLVNIIDESTLQFSRTIMTNWFVNTFPALKYIPAWMPGTGWKKVGMEWQRTLNEAMEKPFLFAKQQLANGIPKKSFITDSLRSRDDKKSPMNDDYVLKWTAMSMYIGGADTSVNTLTAFFFSMVQFPEVQRKAQEEIDRVIGTSRLPAFSDRESLPYIDAVVTEAWRWHTVVPMSLAHTTNADDIVNGYYIPKGAFVIPNVWWFTHDPAVYPNPSEFDPSRYLGPNPAPDPTSHIFGYGRRICPGRYLAYTSVWLTIARSLAVFNISKGLDESGREIEPTTQFSPGLLSRLEPFKATFKPRSSQHEALIRQVEELHPWEPSDADEVQKISRLNMDSEIIPISSILIAGRCRVYREAPNRLMFNSLTAIQDIYTNSNITKAAAYRHPGSLTKENLFSIRDNAEHRRKRKVIGQVVSDRSLRAFHPIMSSQIDIFLQQLLQSSRRSRTVNMTTACNRLGIDVVGYMAFGCALKTQTEATNRLIPETMLHGVYLNNIYHTWPSLGRLALISRWLGKKKGSVFTQAVTKMISERTAQPVDSKPDFYATVTGDQGLHPGELWGEALFFVLAGGSTVATAICGSLFHLSWHPSVYARLASEIRETFSSGRDIQPGPTLSSYKPFVVDGHVVPPGTEVGVHLWAIMHNPEYFDDPFTFRPERWLLPTDGDAEETAERRKSRAQMRRAHVAFGLGDRSCAGKSMAYMEASLTIAKILWYFDFERAPGKEGNLGCGKGGKDPWDACDQFQIYDVLGADHDGPNLCFKPRPEQCQDLDPSTESTPQLLAR